MPEAVRTPAPPLNRRREILARATELRGAIDRINPELWAQQYIDCFPRGACGHCAELLARYLRDTMGIEATYASGQVSGRFGDSSHAWLEFDGLVIDISADQFGLPAVMVEPQSEFHASASYVDRHSIIKDDGWWAQHVAAIYAAARETIDTD